jgi:hypothetical protein
MFDQPTQNRFAVSLLKNAGYGTADFRVYRADARYSVDNKIPNKQVLFRSDNHQFLSLVSNRYKEVNHRDMIDHLRDVIENSQLDAKGIKEKITTNASGTKCFVQYRLPEHQIKTPDGDAADLTLLGVNSFDGSFPFVLSVGAHQHACLNGQIFTKGSATLYKSRHIPKLDIEQGILVVQSGLKALEDEAGLWNIWYNRKILRADDPYVCFAAVTGKDHMSVEFSQNAKENESYKYMMSAYEDIYRPKFGSTYWAIYNSMTHWATHARLRKNAKNISDVRHKRSTQVQNVISSNLFPKF